MEKLACLESIVLLGQSPGLSVFFDGGSFLLLGGSASSHHLIGEARDSSVGGLSSRVGCNPRDIRGRLQRP